ncbi:GNAT family N-acetyltransferase [Kushneria indalinina]|uniref:Acetyltransferase (GNAT) family protein n=1 Tax=Kushneria indalinina DSM 14324 TaxID=1122140 RepID=A0A3D9DVY7_9GAMM|nr:GNAT family N-acetyltransferase [Kushneria indalinina]REC94932.1 acetyltransferase (GNAT) family protein [Kushneria indalinina DSM 14324]
MVGRAVSLMLCSMVGAEGTISYSEETTMHLRPALESDFEFAFAVKKEALGPHIAVRWGWDEKFQMALHQQRWREKPWFIVMRDDERIGTLSLLDEGDTVRLGEFYIEGAHRGHGLGTRLLNDVVRDCDASNQNIRLEYLKWNPVASLYKRHGFEVVSENEIHFFMLRTAENR